MNYDVRISTEAAADLRAIFEYIAFHLQAFHSAEAQLARLEKEIFSLNRMPERYHRYDREPWSSRGLRYVAVDRYCVFYISDRQSHTVTILRVLYGGQDMNAVLAQLAGKEENSKIE